MTSADGTEPDMTAAELALGLLDGPDRAAALRRMLAEPAFAHDVETWRTRFASLFAAWPETMPPPHLEERVMGIADGGRDAPIAVTDFRANDRRWWMPVAAGAALAATLVLGVAIGPALRTPSPIAPRTQVPPAIVDAGPLLAAITLAKGGAPVAASYDRRRGEIRLAGNVDVPAGRSAQLWAIAAGAAPRPLGLLGGKATRLPIVPAARQALVSGSTLAISIEPVGGSPTGLPTGPVVATGVLAAA